MAERILILGGTREAADLAAALTAGGHDVTTSLAGRTREPLPVAGRVRTGGFGGADGLARFLQSEGFTRLVDATHPFAPRISANALAAAKAVGLPLEVRLRPPWSATTDDDWHHVADIPRAVAALAAGERVLLALGSQHITPFAARSDIHFVVRMVDAPSEALPLPDHQVVLGRPSADPGREAELLRRHRIDRIVCRNSGGEGAFAKLLAARALRLRVTMIDRPGSGG